MLNQIDLLFKALLTIVTIVLAASCTFQKTQHASPVGYDFNSPITYKMPKDLAEISGITLGSGDEDNMFAINDEDGKLYYFTLSQSEIHHVKFSERGDYEDLAIRKDTVFVLRSDGMLFSFPLLEESKERNLKEQVRAFKVLPKGEYEGLYSEDDKLYVLCKHCRDEGNSNSVTGYILRIRQTGIELDDEFEIKTNEIFKTNKSISPSALAKHPITNDWYILSSTRRCIVVADSNWIAKDFISLEHDSFTQPEGISFDSKGNLYISNEAQGSSSANVLKFRFDSSSVKKDD